MARPENGWAVIEGIFGGGELSLCLGGQRKWSVEQTRCREIDKGSEVEGGLGGRE